LAKRAKRGAANEQPELEPQADRADAVSGTPAGSAQDQLPPASADEGATAAGEAHLAAAVVPLRITEPGIYDMPELAYHSDPCPVPSFSRSIGKLLINASPAHAYAEHPRLGGSPPDGPAAGDEDMDVGTAVHAMFLQGVDIVAHIPFATYATNAAKAMRDDARKAGKVPLKTAAYDRAMRQREALEQFRKETGLFREGKAEQTLCWDEGDLWCRARVDWLPDDPALPLLDLKTTGGLASPQTWTRQCFDFGGDMQASLYPRGCEFLRGEPPGGFMFVVCEQNLPYGIRTFALDPVALEVGEAKCSVARELWVKCMQLGEWPGYTHEIEWLLPPAWVVRQWEEARLTIGRGFRNRENPELIDHMIAAGNMGG
jgi:hypothetical protein